MRGGALLLLAGLLLSGAVRAEEGDLPPGHPPVDDAQAAHPTVPGRPPADSIAVDEALQAGTVVATIADADDHPMPGAPVELDIDKNTVARGESRQVLRAVADAHGQAIFPGLQGGMGVSFKVKTTRGGAVFASEPFAVKERAGLRVALHSYEPVTDLSQAMLVMEAYVVVDLKQDTIRVNHLLHTFNLGKTAYVARGLLLKLPEGAKAFNQEQTSGEMEMADSFEHPGTLELRGTFPPGQAEIAYAYTIPLDSGERVHLDLPLPPRVVAAQVSVSAGPGMQLDIRGFPPAEWTRRRDGQRVLQTTRQVDLTQDPRRFLADLRPGALDMTVRGLPTSGSGPIAAVVLAALALLIGLSQLRSAGEDGDDLREELTDAREALIGELAALDRAREAGEVGPQSYQRIRAALLDALGRILVRLDGSASRA